MNKGFKIKEVEFKHSPTDLWKEDEKLLCKKKQCKFNVHYLGSVEIDKPRLEPFYNKAMSSLLEKKKRSGELIINVYSIVLLDKATHALILDQTLKKVTHCCSYITVPYSFYYVADDLSSDSSKMYGFVSCKEVSERVVNAIDYAREIFYEEENKSAKIQQINQVNQDDSDTKFKQTTLAEKYQDPQSSIIIERPLLKCPRTLPELKAIPRPRVAKSIERNAFGNSFRKLSQDEMFKPNGHLSKSVEVKQDLSLDDVFNNMSNGSDPVNVSMEEKLQRIHRINEAYHKSNAQSFENSFNDCRSIEKNTDPNSRFDSFRNVTTDGDFGWSANVTKGNDHGQTSTKTYNTYLDNIVISEFFHTNPFNAQSNFSSKH